ncbi:hypothetical protein ACX3P5_08010 [Pantoea sp. S-LA4]|jgi:hypothetical protein|uniref:hypothetical protein n=1 Tax=Pantoea TaxID=53335 RepID=UPI001F3597A1|nr:MULTISPECIES: hypothetical protein [Pantoea]UIL50850.1 hypothetical protein LZU96_11290 [Pantoea agglomerans]
MARRRELKGISHSLNGSFVSRNNDYKGFWTIGLLKQFSIGQGLKSVKFTFPMYISRANSDLINDTGHRYTVMLADLMLKQQLPNSWVKKAGIVIDFYPNDNAAQSAEYHTSGDPFKCLCQITDDRGSDYSSIIYGRCLPHSPARELRSNRYLC